MLDTTKQVISDLKDASTIDQILDLRLFWVLNLTLLGVVKDVFWKVDMNRAEATARKLMQQVYENHKSEGIFDFVNSDTRNRLLHRYEHDWDGEDYVEYGYVEEGYVEQAKLTRGSLAGKHPVGIIRQAIEWWETVIAEIERSTN
jgi:hypothetical protein